MPLSTRIMEMRSDHQNNIDKFMEKAGQEFPTAPVTPSKEVRLLQANLILEEALETITALGFIVSVEIESNSQGEKRHETYLYENGKPDLIEIADGCADISVVTIGTLSACGISDLPLLEVIDQSNLAKFGPGGHRREDGKWVKPADWKKPDIAAVLERMRA